MDSPNGKMISLVAEYDSPNGKMISLVAEYVKR